MNTTTGAARTSATQATSIHYPETPSGFAVCRGTNLSHWLSQDFKWRPRNEWIDENDIRFIAREGFDHIRLPIDEQELWNEDGTRNTDAFRLMRSAIDWAVFAGLRVVLDLHVLRSHHFNADNEGGANTLFSDPAEQRHMAAIWKDLSAYVGDIPVCYLAYEIMNEPVADKPGDWNRLAAMITASIRETEDARVIIIGANRWQIPRSFPHLEVPEGDPNLLLSMHVYAPIILSHYKAQWTPFRSYAGPVGYPGLIVPQEEAEAFDAANGNGTLRFLDEGMAKGTEEWNLDRIRREIAPAITRAKELKLGLYCGEFGCLPSVPRAARLAYYHDMIQAFEENGIAWANWEYKGDYGIFTWREEDKHCGTPDADLLEVLTGRGRFPRYR